MDQRSVYEEGYDALDVNTNVAIEFVRTHKSELAERRMANLVKARAPEVERTLIVVDTACDVPQAWLDHHGVAVMPRSIRVSNKSFSETRDRDTAMYAIKQLAMGAMDGAASAPLAPLAMREEMQKHMQPGTEAVLHICFSARRSKHFVHALSATQSLVLIHNKVRRTLGQPSSLTAWVIDSVNAFGGIGVLLAQAVTLRERGALAPNIAVSLNAFRNNVHTLVAPRDLAYVARSARLYEGIGVPKWKLGVATMLDLKPIVHLKADKIAVLSKVRGHLTAMTTILDDTARLVGNGALLSPFIAASYAGRLDEIENIPAYRNLRTLCSRHQVTLSLSVMSITGAITLGPGALAVSFASQQYKR